MASNGPEPSGTVNLGSNASPRDVDYFRKGWQAAIRGEEEPEYPCGGLYGVAVVWFAAGLMVAALMIAIWLV